jgi:hypothetical protein
VAVRRLSLVPLAWLAAGAALVLALGTAVLAVAGQDVSGAFVPGADQEQIRRAVCAAASGEIIFGTELAARVLAYSLPRRPRRPSSRS